MQRRKNIRSSTHGAHCYASPTSHSTTSRAARHGMSMALQRRPILAAPRASRPSTSTARPYLLANRFGCALQRSAASHPTRARTTRAQAQTDAGTHPRAGTHACTTNAQTHTQHSTAQHRLTRRIEQLAQNCAEERVQILRRCNRRVRRDRLCTVVARPNGGCQSQRRSPVLMRTDDCDGWMR